MENELLKKVADKTLTKEELRQRVKQDFDLLRVLLKGIGSPKATV